MVENRVLRRRIRTGAAVAALSIATSFLVPSASQAQVDDPPYFFQIRPESAQIFEPFVNTKIGETSDGDLAHFSSLQRTELEDGLVRYGSPSVVGSLRENVIVTENGGRVLFKRALTPGTPRVLADQYYSLYGSPDIVIDPPSFYPTLRFYADTQVFTRHGFAIVTNPETREVYELQVFEPTTLNDYFNRWNQIA